MFCFYLNSFHGVKRSPAGTPHGAPRKKEKKKTSTKGEARPDRATWAVKVERPCGVKVRTAGKKNGVEHVVDPVGNPVVISPMDTHIHTQTDRPTDKMKDAWSAKHGDKQQDRPEAR